MSVVIPTFNEAPNIRELLARLNAGLEGDVCEVIFVDDSTDDTPDVIRRAAGEQNMQVSLIHRDEPVGGLGGAVVRGIQLSRYPWVVVCDGDLQHPPERIPALLAAGEHADIVVASRYRDAGAADGLSGAPRRLISRGSTLAAKTMFPRRLASCTDPMSGFFALRRGAVDFDALAPNGFKILLEILARSDLRIEEVPFTFEERTAGESKAGFREGVKFLRQLAVLRMPASVRFGLVGLSGILPNLLVMATAIALGLFYFPAAILATQAAVLWNFVGCEAFVWHDRRTRNTWRRFTRFWFVSQTDLLRLPALVLLISVLGMNPILATLVTLIAAFAARFALTSRFVYPSRQPSASTLAEQVQ